MTLGRSRSSAESVQAKCRSGSKLACYLRGLSVSKGMRSVSATLLIRILALGSTLVTSVILARTLGPNGYGVYGFCVAVVQVLAVAGQFGQAKMALREIASALAGGSFDRMRGLIQFSAISVTIFSCMLSLVAAISAMVFDGWEDMQRRAFFLALCLIPTLSLTQLLGAVIRGCHKVVLSQLLEYLRPFLMVLLLLGIPLIGINLTPFTALLLNLAAALTALCFLIFAGLAVLRRKIQGVSATYYIRKWTYSSLHFVMIGGLQILTRQISIIMLGIMQPESQVGYFRMAHRIPMLLLVGVGAIKTTIAPKVSTLNARRETKELQKLLNRSAVGIVGYSLPLTAILISSSFWIVPFVYGVEYEPAIKPLIIITMGEAFTALIGPAPLVLNMTGNERIVSKVSIGGILFMVSVNFLLIPPLGATGSAISYALTFTTMYIAFDQILRKRAGVTTCLLKTSGIVGTAKTSLPQK